jgi:hypothetical protein
MFSVISSTNTAKNEARKETCQNEDRTYTLEMKILLARLKSF